VKNIVLSASRRTDIPAFYMPWFMEGIARGEFEVVNPYSRKTTRVPATTPPVHTIVFWSKNFGPFIDGGWPATAKMGYTCSSSSPSPRKTVARALVPCSRRG
jgi:hypothetical protein